MPARKGSPVPELESEIRALQARVAELEQELIAVEDWANRSVGAVQERLYWLDRWDVDLNALMERPGAEEFRALIRGVRSVYRFLRELKGRMATRA